MITKYVLANFLRPNTMVFENFGLYHIRQTRYKTLANLYFPPVVTLTSVVEVSQLWNVRFVSTSTRAISKKTKSLTYKRPKIRKNVYSSERGRKNRTPSAGYIGDTNFNLLVPMFESRLPYLKDKRIKIIDLVNKTINYHDSLIENHGVLHGTSRWKSITQYSTGVLEGREPDNPGWVATGKVNKFPRCLGHLLPLVIFVLDNVNNEDDSIKEQVAETRRLLHTLFKLNRVCNANREIVDHIKTIQSKFPIDPAMLARFEQYVRKRLADQRDVIDLTEMQIGFFLGASNGPNLRPKTHSALEEAAVLVHSKQFSKLFTAVEKFCKLTNNNEFLDFLTDSAKKYQNLPSSLTDIKLRKLVAIPDSGNKSRVIAICDFWTQCVLAPLETKVLNITRELFQEKVAFDSHAEGWAKIMASPQEIRKDLVSLDASSWTDNFPAVLQYIVIKALFGQPLADSWKEIAVDCPWYVPSLPRPINFGKGQGMGTKASFAIAQLTDLLFIDMILGSNTFYVKVGDDLVVHDPESILAGSYEKIGVPINLGKSKLSTSHGDFVEFVSRNMWNGIDYSIISPTLVSKYLRDDYYSVTLLNHIQERTVDRLSLKHLVQYKKEVLKSRKNFCLDSFNKRQAKLMHCIRLMQIAGYDLSHIEIDDNVLPKLNKQESITFVANLVLVTLCEMSLKQEFLASSDNEQQERTIGILSGLLRETGIANPSSARFFKRAYPEFFRRVNLERFTFQEAILVWRSMRFLEQIQTDTEKGILNHFNFQFDTPFQFHGENIYLNPHFLKQVLEIWESMLRSEVNHNVVNSDPFIEKGKSKPMALELFKLLNKSLCYDKYVVDMSTLQYTPAGSTKPAALNAELVSGFESLFKIQRFLTDVSHVEKSVSPDSLLSFEFPSNVSGDPSNSSLQGESGTSDT